MEKFFFQISCELNKNFKFPSHKHHLDINQIQINYADQSVNLVISFIILMMFSNNINLLILSKGLQLFLRIVIYLLIILLNLEDINYYKWKIESIESLTYLFYLNFCC